MKTETDRIKAELERRLPELRRRLAALEQAKKVSQATMQTMVGPIRRT